MANEAKSLEALVKERTAELNLANAALRKEVERSREIEAELRGSWEYFRLIVEAAPVGVLMFSKERGITLANDAACAIFGYTLEELVGLDMTVLTPELSQIETFETPKAKDDAPAAKKRGREIIGRRKDGREVAVEVEVTQLRAAAGMVGMASIVDVTERRENQQNLQRLAAIVQSSDDAIISETLDGIVTSWNPGATRLFGYTAEEMVGLSTALVIPPERVLEEVDMLNRVREGKVVDHFETVRRRKDGLLFDVSVTVSPMIDSAGRVVGAAKIARDITERKRTMNALRELNEVLEQRVDERTAQLTKAEVRSRSQAQLLEAVFHSMAEGVAIADASGQLTHFNPAAERLLGLGLQPVAPEAIPSAYGLYREDQETSYPAGDLPLARALRGETPEPIELFVRNAQKPAGALLSVNARPMLDSAGAVRGAVAVFHDVTEQNRAAELVEASLREKDALLREIHHRVKNNMQIISSILRLQAQYIKDPHLHEVFKDCQGRIRTMALIHEMLYQSKGLARIDFKTYLQSLAGLLLRAQSNKGLTLRHQFDIAPAQLTMDLAIPVGLIANELLTNCLKHAFTGRKKGLVRVALKVHDAGHIELIIADDGHGLPADFAPEKSASLGLRLVKILSDQIKGHLEWKSAGGAEFVLTFRDHSAVSPPTAPVSQP